jgi:hypothetical protein
MEGIGKIHPLAHPVQSLGEEQGFLDGDVRQPGEILKRLRNSVRGKAIAASQNPFAFEQHRSPVSIAVRAPWPIPIVGGQEPDNNIDINRAHGASLLWL